MVRTTDLLDHSVDSKTLEHAGHLRAGFAREASADGLVGNTADAVFATDQSFHEGLIFGREEIETGIRVLTFAHACRDFAKCVDPRRWRVDGRDELQVTAIGGAQHLA
jgi:hypothetical protein